jgi:phage baseplate assembly protein gpV
VPAGVVLSQNPVAGASAAPGSAVAMTVSAGPQPITGSILINNNRSATNNPAVTLNLTWGGGAGTGVVRMRFSDDGTTWTPWEVLSATKPHTLPAGDAHKTVRVQYLDKLSNHSAIYSDYIRLDTVKPTGAIIINGGAATTTTRSVTLGLTWADGTGAQVSRMRFSDNGSTWTPWMTPTATRAHTLPLATLGNQTVRVQYLDGAGNYSLIYNDYIKLVAP